MLDPTLLLTPKDWSEIARMPPDIQVSEYVLLYAISEKRNAVAAVNQLASTYGLNKLEIASGERSPLSGMEDATFMQFAGPEEFLGVFANAKHAVVSSFHGLCFCILNHIDFFYSLPCDSSKEVNNRVIDLAQVLGIRRRTVEDLMQGTQERINWDEIDLKLEQQRKNSLEMLECSLESFKS